MTNATGNWNEALWTAATDKVDRNFCARTRYYQGRGADDPRSAWYCQGQKDQEITRVSALHTANTS